MVGGGVDLALGFKKNWDGVYNFFFFCLPLGFMLNLEDMCYKDWKKNFIRLTETHMACVKSFRLKGEETIAW